MEPPPSPSCNGRDRISNLPDALIHHILSFTDMNEAVQTSLLSRRWRYLWTSLPTLILFHGHFNGPHSDRRFTNFVNNVLLLRDNSDIQKFYLYCDCTEMEFESTSFLNNWIRAAVKRNVQKLIVTAIICQPFRFPKRLFTCESLTKLKLNMGSRYESQIILPDSISLPRLKSLKLSALSFGDDDGGSENPLTNKFFSSCPVLESLIIEDCNISFSISSLTLKHFEMKNYDYFSDGTRYENFRVNSVKLYAPNLTSLICKDYILENYSLENVSALVTANIGMINEEHGPGDDNSPDLYTKCSIEVKEFYAQHMMKILRAVHNVKDLKLHPGCLEVIFGAPDLLDSQPPQFCNLRCLKLKTWVSRNCMNAITYLLNVSPNIESLFLKIAEAISTNIGDDWEAELAFPCMLYHLKFVKIQGSLGCVNELKLLEILLKNSMVLKEVVLFSVEEDSSDRRYVEFKEKLLSFPRASSSVSIVFKTQ